MPNSYQLRILAFYVIVLSCGSSSISAEEQASNHTDEPPITSADREYWAYQPVVRPEVPQIEKNDWSLNPIDKFILQKLNEKRLNPVPRATRLTLLRRVTFDLTGLPPTIEDIDQFLATEPEAAYEVAVERLLDSSAYGERWAQHWLDLVRFAETDGFEHDKVRPEAWRYRDWVIDALNSDMPYDRFLQLQIAGDELEPDSAQATIATGYLLAGPDMPDINSQVERRHNFLNGMTANVGEVILGLRFGCAQCHHHRTDPISQHDFYRLRGYFESIDLFKDQKVELAGDQVVNVRASRNKTKTEEATYLWIRGDYTRQGPQLTVSIPRVMQRNRHDKSNESTNPALRSDLAKWLTDPESPLTARVMVNRIWQHHFGRGLIATPSDFGWMGESASHPELLDWLAAEFMEKGWSLKQMHRLIVTSATYQQASYRAEYLKKQDHSQWEKSLAADPENSLLGRMNRRRLEGEAIRDAILAVSGELNRMAGGPGVRPPLPPAVAGTLLKNQWPVTKDESQHTRRTIYLFARRNLRMPLLEAFDKPDTNLSCPRRSQTTIAPQALHLLNSEFVREQAEAFAKRVMTTEPERSARVELAYRLSMGRGPNQQEMVRCHEFLDHETESPAAWTDLCHAIFNLNEFIYLD